MLQIIPTEVEAVPINLAGPMMPLDITDRLTGPIIPTAVIFLSHATTWDTVTTIVTDDTRAETELEIGETIDLIGGMTGGTAEMVAEFVYSTTSGEEVDKEGPL